MTFSARVRDVLGLWPDPNDVEAVARMTADQWRRAAKTKPSYLRGYQDRPGSPDRAQRRAEWIAALPIFEGAASVTEVGCACGRNLAALARRYPGMRVSGYDVSSEALDYAKRAARATTTNVGTFVTLDMYEWARPSGAEYPFVLSDIVLTVGVLGHLHPAVVGGVLCRLRREGAEVALVMVEEFGTGEVLKGPRSWKPEQVTDDYVLWRVPLTALPREANLERFAVPTDLQAPGAREVVIWR